METAQGTVIDFYKQDFAKENTKSLAYFIDEALKKAYEEGFEAGKDFINDRLDKFYN
jgi:hypothetical protein